MYPVDVMLDHNNNGDNDVLRCQATVTSAASRESGLQSNDETRRRHSDVALTSLIGDDINDASWSCDSGSETTGCGHNTTGGTSSSSSSSSSS